MNVIVVLIDTLRRDSLGPYGGGPTPALERVAAAGVTFDRFFLGSYPCMPARRDLWTGRYEFPWRGWGPLLPGDRDLPGVLTGSGVRTMLVTDHYHLFQPGAGNYHFGFEGWEFIRGQEDDHHRTAAPGPVPWPAARERKLHRRWERYWRNTADRRAGLRWRSAEDTFAMRTFATAEAWLRANPDDGVPFFLMIDCFDPHEPFDPPPEYWPSGVAPNGAIPWPIYGPSDRYTPQELAEIRALYAAEVSLVDAALGRFWEACERLGRLRDTLILVTTDHGHLFGEHGMIGKPSTVHGDSNLYRPLAHVPLLAFHPEALGSGTRIPALAQMVDLYPTVLEAMGVPRPQGEQAPQGHSLLPYLTGRRGARDAHRDYAFYGKFGEAVQVTDGDLVLHQWPPTDENAPLYWYGPEPPAFLRPRGVGAFEGDRGRYGRYPIDWVRGPNHTILLDAGEERDLSAERPGEVARLQGALRAWLAGGGGPPEQARRLGL